MAELTDTLNEMLAGRTGQISRRIGADEGRTRVAVESPLDSIGDMLGGDRSR